MKDSSNAVFHSVQWQPPEQEWIKINVYAACPLYSEVMGIAVISNHDGVIIQACLMKSKNLSALQAKMLTILTEIKLGCKYSNSNLILESDYLGIIQALLGTATNCP